MLGMDIGIDLGTAMILIYIKGRGVVMREPSVVAIDQNTNKILAVGSEAKRMLGRTPGNVVAVRPLQSGVIANYTMTEAMIRHFLKKVMSGINKFLRHRVMIGVPSGATDVERRAVLEAALEVGAKEAYLIEEPMAAAIGAGLAIEEPRGNMIVDVGGGTSDIAVISLGGLVVAESPRLGGDAMDEAIIRYVRKKYNLEIGSQTAEALKISIGNCCKISNGNARTMIVKGRDVVLGLPRQVELTTDDVREAIEDIVSSIIRSIRRVLELTPAELSADIIDRGIALTGGGALLQGLPELIYEQTGIHTYVADSPLECVALGTGKALEELNALREAGAVYSALKKSSSPWR
ncbi:MAG TPA: rod shape-determining protein [Acetomicrobium sp.]|uniref:rod shape-determining protein n=1 Tax=Acetomicrobium sp. TaxID=1872099 RepID=UPI002B25BE67|nr:rod shape-determining protein [Acetomicrobium sp.]HPT65262.1 rod shape-determining protein [Acetomicrobium sp.]HXK99001.1 rod shape-determining protein [Acetomicrobium sp.]